MCINWEFLTLPWTSEKLFKNSAMLYFQIDAVQAGAKSASL